MTIDLDHVTMKRASEIVAKISLLPCSQTVILRPSEAKGYHIIIHGDCRKRNCDLCRLAFDDPNRYFYDSNRPNRQKNVLFTRKEYDNAQLREINRTIHPCASARNDDPTTAKSNG